MPKMIALFICLCLSFKQIASGDCFWIDGTVAKGHTPCYDLNSVGASMCCARDSPSFTSFLPGGICQYQNTGGAQGPHDNGTSFWRDSCSDRTWQDAACLAMAPYVKSSDVRLNMCDDGSFCPRTDDDVNMTCCDNHQGQYATNNGATLPASSSTSTENAAQATSTVSASLSHNTMSISGLTPSTTSADVLPSSSASSPAPKPSSDGSSGLSKVATIATVLGTVFGLIALGATLAFGINGWKSHKNRRRLEDHTSKGFVVIGECHL